MERRQVITITVEGTMQGLQVKPGKGLDLTKFGNASVVRASEIVWHEKDQAWMIDVLQKAGHGVVTFERFVAALDSKVTALQKLRAAGCLVTVGDHVPHDADALTFLNYEAAVAIEIAYLDALRLRGIY